MEILFKKRQGRKNIITYKRDTLNDYWFEADDFLVLHDLSHYAIEATLKYSSAFWGLIKSGINPSVFENKELRDKILITNEAWYAECLANLVLIELSQGEFENFNLVFKESVQQMNKNIPDIVLTNEQINAIRMFYKKLIQQWRSLETDNTMILLF